MLEARDLNCCNLGVATTGLADQCLRGKERHPRQDEDKIMTINSTAVEKRMPSYKTNFSSFGEGLIKHSSSTLSRGK